MKLHEIADINKTYGVGNVTEGKVLFYTQYEEPELRTPKEYEAGMSIRILRVRNCNKITSLAGLPKELEEVQNVFISHCPLLSDIDGVPNTVDIEIRNCPKIKSLAPLGAVYTLSLENMDGITNESLKDLGRVGSLNMFNCHNVTSFAGIEHAEDIEDIVFKNTTKQLPTHLLGLLLIPELYTVKFMCVDDKASEEVSEIITEHLQKPLSGNHKKRMRECQADLVAAGYEEQAKL